MPPVAGSASVPAAAPEYQNLGGSAQAQSAARSFVLSSHYHCHYHCHCQHPLLWIWMSCTHGGQHGAGTPERTLWPAQAQMQVLVLIPIPIPIPMPKLRPRSPSRARPGTRNQKREQRECSVCPTCPRARTPQSTPPACTLWHSMQRQTRTRDRNLLPLLPPPLLAAAPSLTCSLLLGSRSQTRSIAIHHRLHAKDLPVPSAAMP